MINLLAIIVVFTGSQVVPEDYYELSAGEFFALEEVGQPIAPGSFNRELMEAAVFFATNEERKRRSKPAFDYSQVLNRAARFHAEFLKTNEKVDHLNLRQKKYKTPYERTKAFGADFSSVAENLARIPVHQLGKNGEFFVDKKGQLVDANRKPLSTYTYAELARKVVQGWMGSEGHRKNIMNDFGLLGLGVSGIAINKQGIPEIYLVQNFANP